MKKVLECILNILYLQYRNNTAELYGRKIAKRIQDLLSDCFVHFFTGYSLSLFSAKELSILNITVLWPVYWIVHTMFMLEQCSALSFLWEGLREKSLQERQIG